MPHINLLPWRETLEKERRLRFIIITSIAVALMAVACLGVYLFIEGEITYQSQRNAFLDAEIKKLDEQIKEIERLEKQKTRLVERMNVIQDLQASRPRVVHLFDELVRKLPSGVYFTLMEPFPNEKDRIKLEGVSQSEARVSSLIRNLENSEWLSNPTIVFIRTEELKSVTSSSAANKPQRTISAFQLLVNQVSPKKPGEENKDAAKPGTPGATPPKK